MAISGLEQDGSGFLRGLAAVQAETAAGRRLPPVDKWNPPDCGPIDMRIARDGTWHYIGTPIRRPALVRLFSTILRREPDDSYVLVTPGEKVTIQVEDVPFIAVRVDRSGEGHDQALSFLTDVGDTVTADAEHPIRVVEDRATREPRPYILVRGRLEARLSRQVFYELVEMAHEEKVGGLLKLGVKSRGAFFPLGDAPDASSR